MKNDNAGVGGTSAARVCVGEIVGMKLRRAFNFLSVGLAALGLLSLSGCKGGGGANIVTVAVSSSQGTVLILGQSTTLTATVSGATNTNVNWQPCQYTIIPTGKTTPNAAVNCPTDGSFGTLSNPQVTGTETYTAPAALPDQTKFPSLQLIFTAQSQQDTSKSGNVKISLISGISVVLNETTATVPTKEQHQFSVQLQNDLQTKGVTWLITQSTPTSTTPVPSLPTCSPGCGTITPDKNNPNLAIYKAPDTVPTSTTTTTTPANVTLLAIAVADTSQFASGTITIIAGGPITFNGISPTIAPQGATFWDIFLDAPNISSSSIITLTGPAIGQITKLSDSGQIKVLFPIPTSTTTAPASTGARLRLNASDLAAAGPITVSVTDPGETVTPSPTGVFTYNIMPVRPTSIATVPDDVVQGSQTQNTRVIIDGGYFGPAGNLTRVYLQSPGNIVSQDGNNPSSARRLNTLLSTSQINAGSPGLYPLYVSSTATPAPNPAATNIAVFPDYSVSPPQLTGGVPTAAGQNPGAIDIDSTLGVAVVAETGSNAIQFYMIGSGTLTPLSTVMSTTQAPINVPTGVSVDRIHHTVAVVNYGTLTKDNNGNFIPTGQSVTVLPIPTAPGTPITPFSVDISGALQGVSAAQGLPTPPPMPYAIGVDPDSNLALVAYSSTSSSSGINVGLIVNLNPDSSTSPPNECLLDHAINSQSTRMGQCLFSQVTLDTGTYPHIAMAPHGHLAFVTPGGSGVVRGVDVTKPSSANVILSATLTAGLVTVTIDTTKCPPPLPNPTSTLNLCPFSMIPGNAGTVLITGLKAGNTANSALFNGLFNVSVTSNNSFTYAVSSTVSDTASAPSGANATVFYGSPDLIFPVSATLQGIAVNPITNTAALADANATGRNGSQIDLLNSLEQSVTSITFSAGCTAFTTACSGAPELLATTDVAWQPYTNALVSYNPQQKLVSVSDPVSRQRYAIVNVTGSSAVAFPVVNGTTGTLTLWGGIAVDPTSNQALVLESGSGPQKPGQIEIINLGNLGANNFNALKPTHISELIVPSPTPGPGVIGGVPNALVPQATLTCVAKPPALPSSCDLAGVQIFGSGFTAGAQVRLDGVSIPSANVQVASGRAMDVTIPASFLSAPHHYSLDVISGGAQSNSTDFIVIQAVDMSKICFDSSTPPKPINTVPTSVAIADQLANGSFSPIAVVSNSGCNSISVLDVNPTVTVNGQVQPNPNLGKVLNTIAVGTSPQGIAISQHLGLAVVANNGSNNASVVNLVTGKEAVPDVATGTAPAGVAINDATGAAIVANTTSNGISLIDLALLFPTTGTPPTSLTAISIGGIQSPIAVAIDPDRGTNNQGIAVVTALQPVNGTAPFGALAVVDIGLATPALSTTISSGTVTATPTGIVFDPSAATATANPGLFYANSSGSNVISAFNPDNGSGPAVNVGINPTSLAINPQTGAILTANSASKTVSIVDTLSNPLRTLETLGIPGSPLFGVAIDQFTNLAVIVDQANQRVLLFPMPH